MFMQSYAQITICIYFFHTLKVFFFKSLKVYTKFSFAQKELLNYHFILRRLMLCFFYLQTLLCSLHLKKNARVQVFHAIIIIIG